MRLPTFGLDWDVIIKVNAGYCVSKSKRATTAKEGKMSWNLSYNTNSSGLWLWVAELLMRTILLWFFIFRVG